MLLQTPYHVARCKLQPLKMSSPKIPQPNRSSIIIGAIRAEKFDLHVDAVRQATDEDPVLQELYQQINDGLPDSKGDLAFCLRP